MEINEKVVLVTGASEGIGAACVNAFQKRGAKLSLVARSKDKLERVAAGDALAVIGDVTREEDRKRAVERTLEVYGRIDILINNAGVGLYAPSWRAPMEEVRRMFELNLFAALSLTQLVVPQMRARRSGCIVNVGSIAGKVTLPWLTLYSASKYALGSFTDGLRMELARDGVHAITVCPGYVSTRFQEHILLGKVPAGVQRSKAFRISADQCASAILRGVERNARTVVTPRLGWLFVIAERLFPSLVDSQLQDIYFRGLDS
ncbi:MAG TPA: SDR family NAD(P)-dependent oxidoreductase [Bryobacteraceae bacterium]|nr:SDR family NAD(P)-dependent oxidoreductase [Bryobacteraceae bacterium]